jgi:hypothetical protein
MKLSSLQPRTPSTLPNSLHHQLSMYALAATAAGVGVLALAQPAAAKIVYTKTHRVIGPNQKYVIDLNHDGIGDFTIWNEYSCSAGCSDLLAVRQPKWNHVAANVFSSALALSRGAVIDLARFRYSGGLMACACEGFQGFWYDLTNRYLGLKFQIRGKNHFAWARLNVYVASDGIQITATLTGYAYETILNKPIIAGKTKGPDVVTVQSGSLGHLAAGRKAGLAAHRP